MGEDEARAAGFEPRVLGSFEERRSYVLCELERTGGEPVSIACDDFVLTTPDDTEQAARDLVAAGVDLILFAGGDGTARNICRRRRRPRAGHRRARRRQDPLRRVRDHAGRRRRRGRAVPARASRRRAPARGRGHGHRRGGVPREPRVRPALRLHERPLRARPHPERQGRRRGRRGARAQRHRHRGDRRHAPGRPVHPRPGHHDADHHGAARPAQDPARRRRRPRRRARRVGPHARATCSSSPAARPRRSSWSR